MSEDFITRLAGQVVRHPAFTTAIERTVADVLTVVLREQFAGERVRLYVPKMEPKRRSARAEAIAQEHQAGAVVSELARRHGVSERWVFKILAARKVNSSDL